MIRDQQEYNQVTITLPTEKINELFASLKNFNVKFITEVKFSLEKYFKKILIEKKENENVIQ